MAQKVGFSPIASAFFPAMNGKAKVAKQQIPGFVKHPKSPCFHSPILDSQLYFLWMSLTAEFYLKGRDIIYIALLDFCLASEKLTKQLRLVKAALKALQAFHGNFNSIMLWWNFISLSYLYQKI